ncbi:hypothetical protein DYI22_04430 [Marinobacter lipolyticus]|nr:hypothetical protein [Marinobacter lipolyticus]
MRLLLLIVLSSIAHAAHAIPVSYVFGGHVTQVSDATDNPEFQGVDEDGAQLKDWLEVGDRYRGRMTFDTDTIAYDENCNVGTICGGVTYFKINLGERVFSHYFDASSISFMQLSSVTDTKFTSWFHALGTFDSFNFDHGDIRGLDSAYWEGFSGTANYFVRVPEPTPITLILLAFIPLVFRQLLKRKPKASTIPVASAR